MKIQLDFEETKKLISQRFPFIMLDRIVEMEPGKRAVAIKNVSGNGIFFLGHIPEKAVMPGAAIIEAMAQAAIVMFASMNGPPEGGPKPLYHFGSVKARFLHAITPGDQIKITVESVKSLSIGAYVSEETSVSEIKVAEAELVFNVKYE